jgi:Flp pilus assembly protein TadG
VRNLIFRQAGACLARRLTQLRDGGGRGAVAVIVAVLVGSGVLLGMAALVVDVGQLYQNRAELQSGADAAALAVAKACASGNCGPATTTATTYANDNASGLTGHKANVYLVCGAATAGGGSAIQVGTGPCSVAKTVCPANPPAGRNYVDVVTTTLLPNGSHLLPPVFSETLAGNSNYKGSTVYACAQAQWGGPPIGNTIGITMAYCSWFQGTTGGTSYPPLPPYTSSTTPAPTEVDFHNKSAKEDDSNCTGGQTTPGNFGWAINPRNDCTLLTSDFTLAGGSYTYVGNTGNNVPTGCDTKLFNAWNNQTLLYLPVYQAYDGTGSKATYTLKEIAAFAVTGYNFGNSVQEPDRVTGQVPCGKGKSVTCITGYFVNVIDQTPGSIGNADLGYDIIKLTG